MNAKDKLNNLLESNDACSVAIRWSKGMTLSQVWKQCKRADWMLWLLVKMLGSDGWPDKRIVYHLIADCAETSLHYFEDKYPDDKRPRQAIQGLRDYTDGKITLEQLRKFRVAAVAAYAAAATFDATYAAAAAADADAYVAYATAADAAADAAAFAAAAVDADAAFAAADAARKKQLAKMANMIRSKIPRLPRL